MIPAWLMIGYLAMSSADAVTTHVGLNMGAHELILTQSSVKNYAIIGASTVGTVLLTYKLRKQHPRVAKGILLAATCVRAAATANNIRVIIVLQ